MGDEKKTKKHQSDDIDQDEFEEFDFGEEDYELEAFRPATAAKMRPLTARRAIELARDEIALRRDLDDYPEN